MPRTKKVEESSVSSTAPEGVEFVVVEQTEKDKLLALYQELKDRNIRSISDLEHQIATCRS